MTLKPGLFNLLDENEEVIATNPLMEIVVTEGAPQSSVDFTFVTESADPNGKLLLAELPAVTFTFTALTTVSADADAAVVTLNGTAIDKTAYTVTGTDNTVTVSFNPAITSA